MTDSRPSDSEVKESSFTGLLREFHRTWLQGMEKFFETVVRQQSDPTAIETLQQRFIEAWRRSYEAVGKTLGLPLFGDASRLAENVVNVAEIYSRLSQWWHEVAKLGPNWRDSEATRSFLEYWRKSFSSMFPWFSQVFALMPEHDLGEGALKIMLQVWQDSFKAVRLFWESSLEATRQVMGDECSVGTQKERMFDFYDSWLRAYDATLGKLINIPAIGPARLRVEKLAKAMDSYFKFLAASIEFYSKLEQPWLQSMERVSISAAEMLKGGLDPEECRKLYDLLVQTGEERFTELFKSPAFTHSMETILRRSAEFWQSYKEMAEDMLRTVPVATHSDMEEVYRELHSLRRKVKDLKVAIKEIADKTGVEVTI